ncbi:S8 family serine peptidase [candidate division WOR-3 bacterium]|uniref:S8 family serine peptidase n=1 Tax=candidate division WOR-3 bacterium TaxID=2052148 RepID=A0A9D5QD31_UNCW3|nr:S8 family serine peptidase [candidate division WOR-3 bacterium]MBD3365308.1 S8 family serine peptidase [candidate division WOR-3 bacterium]
MTKRCLLLITLGLMLGSIFSGTVAGEWGKNEFLLQFVEDYDLTVENSVVTTGIPSIDSLNEAYEVVRVERVFSKPSNMNSRISTIYDSLGLGRIYLFVTAESIISSSLIEEYAADPGLVYAEFNYIYHTCEQNCSPCIYPDDRYFDLQWGFHSYTANLGWPDADKNAPEGWKVQPVDVGLIVGILDTGIDWQHPDLGPNIWINWGEHPDNEEDNDENGFIDDHRGIDFTISPPGNPLPPPPSLPLYDDDPMDDCGHGTHVAGIVGARFNNVIGVAGQCSDTTLLMPIKALNADGGSIDWIVRGVDYAVSNGASVINMSLSGVESVTLHNAIISAYAAGCVLVAAMGNENTDEPSYPAAYPEVIAVGATDFNDERALGWGEDGTGGSNFGDHIDVVAPGDTILSTYPGKSYHWMSGTSMATPHVSGLAALMRAHDPSLTNNEIRAILHNTSDDEIGLLAEDESGFDDYYGHGRINDYSALIHVDTRSGFQRQDDNPIPLIDDVRISSIRNPGDYTIDERHGEWEILGVRPPKGNNCNITLRDPDNDLLANSEMQEDAVDFIVMYTRPWLGEDYTAQVNYVEENSGKYALEWVKAFGYLIYDSETRSCPFQWQSAHVAEICGIYLPEGTHEIDLKVHSGEFDPAIFLFKPDITPYYADRSSALAMADNHGSGESESFIYTVSESDAGWYALAICSNNGRHGLFDLPCGPTGVTENPTEVITACYLTQNTPNPFTANTSIRYTLPHDNFVTLSIYDVSGQRVKTLVNDIKQAGEYNVQWDSRDEAGKEVPTGVYYYRLESVGYSDTKKMILIR